MAALLSSEMDGAERDKFFVDHIDDCRRMGIEVLQPDINAGELEFSVAEGGKIRFGLGAIKGVGTKAIEAIDQGPREGGPFRSLLDLFERTPQSVVTQGNVETLIKAGALDCLGARRSQLLAVLPRVVQGRPVCSTGPKSNRKHISSTYSTRRPPRPPGPSRRRRRSSCPTSPSCPDVERLAEEKKALGFYMTSHPLARHAAMLQALATHQVADLARPRRQGRGHARRDDQLAPGQERPEEPRRRDPDGQADLRGPHRVDPGDALALRFRQVRGILKDDFIGFVQGTISTAERPARADHHQVIPMDRGAAELSRGLIGPAPQGQHPAGRPRPPAPDRPRLPRQPRPLPRSQQLAKVRRAIYKAGSNLKIRHDDRMLADLEIGVRPR